MRTCVRCGGECVWKDVLDQFSDMLRRVDFYGEACLTEEEQGLYRQAFCVECFEKGM